MSDDSAPADAQERTAVAAAGEPDTVTAKLSRMPAVTQLTVVAALVALPVLVALIDTLGLALGPVAETALQWAVVLAVIGVVVGVEDRSLSSVGFRRPAWRDLVYLVGAAAAALAVFILGAQLVDVLGLPVADRANSVGSRPPLAVGLFAAVTVGVVEEVLYRGYALERLLEYTDSAAVAGTLTVVVFTLAHLVTWPVGNVLLVTLVAVLFTVVYLRRRTLATVAGAHVLIWVVGVLGQHYG